MAYDPQQLALAGRLVRIGRRRGASGKEIVAALETGIVESNLRNLPGGDGDSQGWRQERSSLYPNPRNVRASINRFYDETSKAGSGRGMTAGQLAAAVQRPAAEFRGRYQQHRAEALQLFRALKNGAPLGSLGAGAAGSVGSVTIPGASAQPSAPDGSQGALALIQALGQQQKPQIPSVGLQAPAFSASAALPQGYQAPQAGAVVQPKTDIAGLLSAIQSSGGTTGSSGTGDITVQTGSVSSAGGNSTVPNTKGGKVTIAPGADRSGVSIHKDVVNFVKGVSALTGEKLTIGTGTNHSRLTINGTESDHWRGEGADIPATGKNLIRIGQAALIEAGMPAAKARKITGGGFNVGGFQVIFNTDAPGWGDHTTHLHVGRRRS